MINFESIFKKAYWGVNNFFNAPSEQRAIINGAVNVLRFQTPIDTGNMRYNATYAKYLGDGVWEIVVDESIAPYVPYTNEPWISEKWNGKKNPNEGWFDRASALVATYIAGRLQGQVERKE